MTTSSGEKLKDYLSVTQLAPDVLRSLLELALKIKKSPGDFSKVLAGKSVVLLFEKPSLRTRVSFEVGITRLGGHAFFYDHSKERIGMRESLKDYAKNLERFVHAVVARVFEQSVLEGMAEHARIPIVNALSNEEHPCQGLADAFTLHERFGKVAGLKVAYIGDGNNVATSLAQAVVLLGGHFVMIAPRSYGLSKDALEKLRDLAAIGGGSVTTSTERDAVSGVDAIYTDAWVSMHHTDAEKRQRALRPYQVNAQLMEKAAKHAIFMHCLPAERGHEVTDEVMDSGQSAVYDQAENRLHAQNALMVRLLGA
jgi:ornithine carbamoyltransferase